MKAEELKNKIANYDAITGEHCRRVGHAARLLAEKLNYTESFCNTIEMAGFLHDAGKLKIDLSILNKNGMLTDYEREAINQHVVEGKSIVESLEDVKPEYIQAAAEHHAYFKNKDKGYSAYPGKTPSLVAQIMAIADVYDALANKRSYKAEMSRDKVMEIMDKCLADGQFNPKFYNTFVKEVVPILEAEKEKTKEKNMDVTRQPISERFQSAVKEAHATQVASAGKDIARMRDDFCL